MPRNTALPLGVQAPWTLVRPNDTVGGASAAAAGASLHRINPTPSAAARDFTYEKPNILPLAAGSRMRPQPTE